MPRRAFPGWAGIPCIDTERGDERVSAMPVVGPVEVYVPDDENGGHGGSIGFAAGTRGWIVLRKDGAYEGVMAHSPSDQHAGHVRPDRIVTVCEYEEAKKMKASAEAARVAAEKAAAEEAARVDAEKKKADSDAAHGSSGTPPTKEKKTEGSAG